jgi:hypothetical protein
MASERVKRVGQRVRWGSSVAVRNVRLGQQEETCIREIQGALAGPKGEPSVSHVFRRAISELWVQVVKGGPSRERQTAP